MSTESPTLELEILPPAAMSALAVLEPSQSETLAGSFRPIFIRAKQAKDAARGVAESVRDATCVTEIKRSRACRLAIRAVRLESDANRKKQKKTALQYGLAVDGFHNILLADLSPVEQQLQDAEDTAERAETARLDAQEQGRLTALRPYVSDPSIYGVRLMPGPTFAELLNNSRIAHEAVQAAKKAEAEKKLAEEKAERDRIEAQRVENLRLAKLAAEQEAALKAEREAAAKAQAEAQRKIDDERREAEHARIAAATKARLEREEIEAKAKAEREAAEEKADTERKAALAKAAEDAVKARRHAANLKAIADKAEAEAQALRDAETKRVADAAKAEQDRLAAEAETARKVAAAPDRDKLLDFANALHAVTDALPIMWTADGKRIRDEYRDRVRGLIANIQHEAAKL